MPVYGGLEIIMAKKADTKKTSIGGQALIEGIMMRGPKKTLLAVRTPEGTITTEQLHEKRLKDKFPFLGWPVLRGIVNFAESMKLGYRALMKSAELAGFDEEDVEKTKSKKAKNSHADTTENMASENVVAEAPRQDGGAHELSGFAERHNVIEPEYTAQAEPSDSRQAAQEQTAPASESGKKKEENSAFWGVIMAVSSVLGVALAVFLFLYMPAFLFDLINSGTRGAVTAWRPVIEGVMKIALFVGYLSVVTMMRDIKRMFQYHGAEHKAIFCYESGKELTVENVRGFKRFHPRCGTSFMILMLLVSIVVAAVILHFFPLLKDLRILWVFIKLVVIMPLTCALGYELLRVCGRHENILTKIVSAPGMWVQRLTTKEPDDSMIEVAINALNGVIPENANADSW